MAPWWGLRESWSSDLSCPRVDADPHVLARCRELKRVAGAVEWELGADEVGDVQPAVGNEAGHGVEAVEAAGRGADDLPLVVVDVVGHDRKLGGGREGGGQGNPGAGGQRGGGG